jgi:hypothetical protein
MRIEIICTGDEVLTGNSGAQTKPWSQDQKNFGHPFRPGRGNQSTGRVVRERAGRRSGRTR